MVHFAAGKGIPLGIARFLLQQTTRRWTPMA